MSENPNQDRPPVPQPVLLIISPNARNRERIARVSKEMETRVVEAAAVEEGLEALPACAADGVIIEVDDGKGDAYDITRTLLARDPRLILVLVTARPKDRAVLEALRAGAFDFLPKPLRTAEMHGVISRLCLTIEQRRELVLSPEQLLEAGLTMELVSARSSLTPAVNLLKELLRGFVDGAALARFDIALQEILINAYEHGNLGVTWDEKTALCETGRLEDELESRSAKARREGKKIRVSAAVSGGVFECRVEDEGRGFDWRNLPDPVRDETALTRLNGRGLLIIKRTFDEVTYNEQGNIVTVRARLSHIA